MSTGIEISSTPPPPPPLPVPAAEDAQFTASAQAPLRTCPNCGAPAHGPYCYACGQSEKGMIRHLSEVTSDLFDIVFNVDSRVFRSLGDLYFRPGYLTTEYLAGRRARYVTPFRLFFFLSIVTFFAIQMVLPDIDAKALQTTMNDDVDLATTTEEVKDAADGEIAVLKAALNAPGIPADSRARIESEIDAVRKRAEKRIEALSVDKGGVPASTDSAPQVDKPDAPAPPVVTFSASAEHPGKSGAATPVEEKTDATAAPGEKPFVFTPFQIDGKRWDSKTDPVRVTWLPDAANAWLTRTAEHMQENVESAQDNPRRLLVGFVSVLPQTLFVVMPLFAVLLKFFYIFKRRLYMEHLLVALHSHAFIFLSILVLLLLAWLADLAANIGWLANVIGVFNAIAWIWLFLYLFLMQKRVYRQGWIMSFIKYCVIGYCYVIFLAFALALAALASLALT